MKIKTKFELGRLGRRSRRKAIEKDMVELSKMVWALNTYPEFNFSVRRISKMIPAITNGAYTRTPMWVHSAIKRVQRDNSEIF